MKNFPYAFGEVIKLPEFTYCKTSHAFTYSKIRQTCSCCGEGTNILYTGPIYCENPPKVLCPNCIYHGACAQKYDSVFILPEQLEQIIEDEYGELCKFTPGVDAVGFRWLTHHRQYCKLVGI